jgi:predicted metal-dependent hydrolase
LVAAASDDTAGLCSQVIAWLKAAAQERFEQRAQHYCARLNIRVPTIRLSDAKTRWGACHPAGRVHLHWKLVQMPPMIVDYVVVHELAHLIEPNHSRRFWRWVASVLPDYRERRRLLRWEAHRYLLPP